MPGKAELAPPVATPGISLTPYGNHWENNGFRMSVKAKCCCFGGPPLGGMGNLTVIRNPLETIGKTWFSQANNPQSQGHKEGSACVELAPCTTWQSTAMLFPFRKRCENQWGINGFQALRVALGTATQRPLSDHTRGQNKKRTYICR